MPEGKVYLIGDVHHQAHFHWVKGMVGDLVRLKGIKRVGIEVTKGDWKKFQVPGLSKMAEKIRGLSFEISDGSPSQGISKSYKAELSDIGAKPFEYDAPPSVRTLGVDLLGINLITRSLELMEKPEGYWEQQNLQSDDLEFIKQVREFGKTGEFQKFVKENEGMIQRVRERREQAREKGDVKQEWHPITDIERGRDKYLIDVREKYFVRNLAKAAEKEDVAAIMGEMHVDRVKKSLEEKGVKVELITRDNFWTWPRKGNT